MDLHATLTKAGAIPRFIGPRLGTYSTANGSTIEADASMENSPNVLFDALVLPDGQQGVAALGAVGNTMEFIKDQYRHSKTILALGASRTLLDKAGVPLDGDRDGGLLTLAPSNKSLAETFMDAVAKHRHPERETDPPRV
jgi:catalase